MLVFSAVFVSLVCWKTAEFCEDNHQSDMLPFEYILFFDQEEGGVKLQ